MAPKEKRVAAWDRLARDLDLDKLAALSVVRPLEDVLQLAPEIMEGRVRGRVVLEVG